MNAVKLHLKLDFKDNQRSKEAQCDHFEYLVFPQVTADVSKRFWVSKHQQWVGKNFFFLQKRQCLLLPIPDIVALVLHYPRRWTLQRRRLSGSRAAEAAGWSGRGGRCWICSTSVQKSWHQKYHFHCYWNKACWWWSSLQAQCLGMDRWLGNKSTTKIIQRVYSIYIYIYLIFEI